MCLVTLSARIAAVTTRVAPPVTESQTPNALMTLASVERASSSATEHVKKVRNDNGKVYCLFKLNLSGGNFVFLTAGALGNSVNC